MKDGIIKDNFMQSENLNSSLTITRNQGQSFRIGENIVIEIQRIEGKRASVKINAPKYVKILRTELYEKIID
jgi:carbon storage regulator